MKHTILLTVLSLATAGGSLLAQPRYSAGISIEGGAPQYDDHGPPAYAPSQNYADDAYDSSGGYDYQPPCPGPGYLWTSGYWYPSGGRRVWRAGFWAPPVYRGYSGRPRFYGPRYYGQGFSRGYQPRGGYQRSYRNNFRGGGSNRSYDRNYRDNSRGQYRR